MSTARALIDGGAEVCALISMPPHLVPAGSANVGAFAAEKMIPYHEVEDINAKESVSLIQAYMPDYVFCTWPKMMAKETLQIPRFCTIGTHPTKLPFNRGRHPMHWIIAMGISENKLSFYRLDEGVDTGNILLQVPLKISPDDAIGDALSALQTAGYQGTRELVSRLLEDPSFIGVEQNHEDANYWRKRTPHDITLDLRMSSSAILRTIRSFAPPYPCANLIFESNIIKIWGGKVAQETDQMLPEQLQRIEPGTVLSAKQNKLRVKVDDAIVDLECVGMLPPRLSRAKYIHPPAKYLVEWSDASARLA